MVDLTGWSYLWEFCADEHVLLRVQDSGSHPLDGCLVYNIKRGGKLIIEDDEVARAVMERMVAAGVPILRKDELPPLEGTVGKILNEMLAAGKSPQEINCFLKRVRDEDRARWHAIMEWQMQRDAERPPNAG